MKCDAGEIACAINRLTETVGTPAGIIWFDWLSRVIVPVLLSALTLGVAVVSVAIARQSSRIAATARHDAVERNLREERAEFGTAALEIAQELRRYYRSKHETIIATGRSMPGSMLLFRALGAEETAPAVRVAEFVTRAYSTREYLASELSQAEFAESAWPRVEYLVRRYVRTGDYEPHYVEILRGDGLFHPFYDSARDDEAEKPVRSTRLRTPFPVRRKVEWREVWNILRGGSSRPLDGEHETST